MIESILKDAIVQAFVELFEKEIPRDSIGFQRTRKEFEGDVTLVVFPLLKWSRKKPDETAQILGEYLLQNCAEVDGFNVIQGFLNLIIAEKFYYAQLGSFANWDGRINSFAPRKIVIEYSSPNTNKPLHLGHIRNNLLGFSLARLLQANGHEVIKVNLVNDRGIHICKSMLAWEKWGGGETPESSGLKGDHLIGKYYVLFDKEYKAEAALLRDKGVRDDDIQQQSLLMQEAREMLRKWEQDDVHVRSLWTKMNAWVYEGFNETYTRLGIEFDKTYYESETYKLGKLLVEEGLSKDVFFKKEDGSVWADLSDQGLDEKLLLRSDGTSVYMTQDLGTAQLRHDDYQADELVYVVGNEQNYHFEVLPKLLKLLGRNWSDSIRHFSYGMVELPQGKMKSREGTVVDADDLMEEMKKTALLKAEEHGKADSLGKQEAASLYEIIGQGALKYFILKVDPKKKMMFNPEESVDFNGNTGPFIQYTHARIKSIFRKAEEQGVQAVLLTNLPLMSKERELVKAILSYTEVLREAGESHSPALVANHLYELAREYNQFYQEYPILNADEAVQRSFRLFLSGMVAKVIREGMYILGIDVPDKM